MPSGITGASITNLVNGTTANASDVLASLNSIKTNGVNNDSGTISTDNSGHITAANGRLSSVIMVAPFQLANNSTITASSTNNYTCTGGSTGVPTVASAVLINAFFTAGSAGMHGDFTPQGSSWNNGNYPMIACPTTALYSGSFIVPLNVANGQLSVRANGGQITGIYMWLYGYIS